MSEPMPADRKGYDAVLRGVYEKIGEFTVLFSQVEQGLRMTLGELLNLHENPALCYAVTASYDFAKLCEVTREASRHMRNDRMDEIDDLINRCLCINTIRVKLAHACG
jgi:hypothetical protein